MANKVFLLGNLGRDPERRGDGPVSIALATSEKFKDRNGEKQERTDWHNVVVWNALADSVMRNLRKGSKIYVEGKLQTRQYDKDGEKRYATEVIANNIEFLTGWGDSQDSQPGQPQQPRQQEYQHPRPVGYQSDPGHQQRQQAGPLYGDQPTFNPDDEIPF